MYNNEQDSSANTPIQQDSTNSNWMQLESNQIESNPDGTIYIHLNSTQFNHSIKSEYDSILVNPTTYKSIQLDTVEIEANPDGSCSILLNSSVSAYLQPNTLGQYWIRFCKRENISKIKTTYSAPDISSHNAIDRDTAERIALTEGMKISDTQLYNYMKKWQFGTKIYPNEPIVPVDKILSGGHWSLVIDREQFVKWIHIHLDNDETKRISPNLVEFNKPEETSEAVKTNTPHGTPTPSSTTNTLLDQIDKLQGEVKEWQKNYRDQVKYTQQVQETANQNHLMMQQALMLSNSPNLQGFIEALEERGVHIKPSQLIDDFKDQTESAIDASIDDKGDSY